MRKGAVFIATCVVVLSTGWAVVQARSAQTAGSSSAAAAVDRAVIDRYCRTCHNERTKASGLALDTVDPSRPESAPDVWERVVRKLRTRTMPPQGMPRPDEATYRTLVTSLETELDRAAALHPNPGRPQIRRLN